MTQNTPSPEENMAQLRELALRLLAPPFDPEARQPQLLVGSLPASLPFDLPLPDGCQVVGSFVRNPETIQIVFDTDQSPTEIIAFYTERMQAVGWSEPDFQRRHRQRESDLPLSLLVAHYAHQLEQAGWQRTGEGSNEPMGWHTWEFQDKENDRWLGVFSLLQIPGMERTYYLQMNINWVGNKAQ